MVLFLVRYGELGLKSERVKRQFLRRLMKDIQNTLMSDGIEHSMEEERGRLYVEAEDGPRTVGALRSVPGIFSFSEVVRVPSDWEGLMKGLSDYGRSRLKEGMTFGLKVRRVGKEGYTSRDVAVHGGGAVSSHLKDGAVKVDLKDPDILFEVEIRGDSAYLFTERVQGMGGLPKASQGRVVLYLPHQDPLTSSAVSRARVSIAMMTRRGCSVHLASLEEDVPIWEDALKGQAHPIHPLKDPDGLLALMGALDARGAVHIMPLERIGQAPLLHDKGEPVATFFPTAAMDDAELPLWERRLIAGG